MVCRGGGGKQNFAGESCSAFSLYLTNSFTGPAAAGEPIACPSCSSDHVVILPSEECSSTPLPTGADSTSEDLSDSVLEGGSQQEGPEEMSVLATESGKFYIGGEDSSEIDTSYSARSPELSAEPEPGSTPHPTCHGSEGGSGKEQGVKSQSLSLSHLDTNGSSLVGSCRHSASRGPTPSPLSVNSESEEIWNLSPCEYEEAVQGLGVLTACCWFYHCCLHGTLSPV